MTARSASPRTLKAASLDRLLADIRACRVCKDHPQGPPLPHEPRPVVRASTTARILIVGQAPGTKVHASGRPFDDRSGDRLRAWMNVTPDVFYDEARIAIAPMGFCFPGQDAKGADLPPRKECAPLWRQRLMAELVSIDLVLLVGTYAQRWALDDARCRSLTDTVRAGPRPLPRPTSALAFPLPHPSWRNTGWLKANPWFEDTILPSLRAAIHERI
ncbi:MAG: uracil-DNA glycosylase [Hyphomicrobium sp. 32-62-53]|nr:MAG: uracil-DNA glycosylase [Hyphomicrobium sp. 12-62-95]OYX99459.1 MAG: uracil-DNA glycosylase [Hyphomicrobium sp. 32-62-53]